MNASLKKSRLFVIISNILVYVGFAGIVSSFFIEYSSIFLTVFDISVTGGIVANLFCTYCPNCHKFGLSPNPFAANAGHCKYCDKLVEYR